MRNRIFLLAACLVLTVLALSVEPFSQTTSPIKLSGVINDFSPRATTPTGPYLVSGPWSLKLHPQGGAEFTASLTMVRSDMWFADTSSDPDVESNRNFHSHHVQVTAGQVTTVGNAIQISGPATVTSNGNQVFAGTTVLVELTGGTTVAPSNLKMTFVGPAAAHFTSQPYDGVVALP